VQLKKNRIRAVTTEQSNSHVTWNDNLLNGAYEALGLLGLELEKPSPFKVAAAERGARNDISGEGLELWPDVQLARTVRTKGQCPSADKLFAARRESWQHELQGHTHEPIDDQLQTQSFNCHYK